MPSRSTQSGILLLLVCSDIVYCGGEHILTKSQIGNHQWSKLFDSSLFIFFVFTRVVTIADLFLYGEISDLSVPDNLCN